MEAQRRGHLLMPHRRRGAAGLGSGCLKRLWSLGLGVLVAVPCAHAAPVSQQSPSSALQSLCGTSRFTGHASLQRSPGGFKIRGLAYILLLFLFKNHLNKPRNKANRIVLDTVFTYLPEENGTDLLQGDDVIRLGALSSSWALFMPRQLPKGILNYFSIKTYT